MKKVRPSYRKEIIFIVLAIITATIITVILSCLYVDQYIYSITRPEVYAYNDDYKPEIIEGELEEDIIFDDITYNVSLRTVFDTERTDMRDNEYMQYSYNFGVYISNDSMGTYNFGQDDFKVEFYQGELYDYDAFNQYYNVDFEDEELIAGSTQNIYFSFEKNFDDSFVDNGDMALLIYPKGTDAPIIIRVNISGEQVEQIIAENH